MSPIERSAGGGGGGGFINPMTTAGDIIIENAVPAAARLAIGAAGQGLGISGGLPAWVNPPGLEVGYDEVTTAAISVASTTEATGTTLISCAAHTFDGSPVLAHFFCPLFQYGTNTSNATIVSLFEGATQIGRLGQVQSASANPSMGIQFVGWYRFTPTAASHTYTVTVFSNSTAATAANFNQSSGGTGGRVPMFIRFTKV